MFDGVECIVIEKVYSFVNHKRQMFTDEALDPVEFKSCWKRERSVVSSGVQTKELEVQDVAVQSIKHRDAEIQTDDLSDRQMDRAEGELDNPALADFLQESESLMITELMKNKRSQAFQGYEPNWEEEINEVSNVHTLTHAALNHQLQVTGLSWNSTGSVIAASYGRFDHEDWCTHKSVLCTWNLDRRSVNANKPDLVIDLPSCLMCIAYHPKQPSWIAGGTFDGEVLVWDITKEGDMLLASSGIGDDSHREPVSKLQWVLDSDSKGKKYHLTSVSSDGKILVWHLSVHKQRLHLQDGFIMLTESLPRSMKARNRRDDQEMGVTCISYTQDDPATFFVGAESGGVFKCSTHTRGTPAPGQIISSVPLRSPVTFTFAPHYGPVYAVDCSPYHRNLFITCGQDASARIYSMLQAEPVVSLEPGAGYLFSAKWSPVRPLVFAVATENGDLYIYDLKANRVVPVHKLEASPKKKPVFTLQFNPVQRQLLATGDGAGYICIWKLSDDLTTSDIQETTELENLANVSTE